MRWSENKTRVAHSEHWERRVSEWVEKLDWKCQVKTVEWGPLSAPPLDTRMISRHVLSILIPASLIISCQGAEQCRTLVTREECIFPFIFNNTEYRACTGAGHPIGRPWCYTGHQQWDYCDSGCPMSEQCPPGWILVKSGCYQVLEVETGVDHDTAKTICAQYGADLLSQDRLRSTGDLRQVLESKADECGDHGVGYWVKQESPSSSSCSVWIQDHGVMQYQPSSTLLSLPCNITSLNRGDIVLQPLCHKTLGSKTSEQVSSTASGSKIWNYLFKTLISKLKHPSCPPGMVSINKSRCLLFANKLHSYEDARQYCHTQGLQLLNLQTEEEVSGVVKLIRKYQRPTCQHIKHLWLDINSRPFQTQNSSLRR